MKLSAWEPDLRTVVDRIDRGDIDLQPDFQRQEVWSPSKKRKLIDTILRQWSIPPVHLIVTSENTLEVLDGQQRLATIRDFFNNKFSIDGYITPVDESLTPLNRQFYRRLDPIVQRRIDQYSLRAFRITEYEPDEPSELFYRLNQPTVLTAGEQRNALYGQARDQLKQLVTEFQDKGNSRETIGFSNARMSYDDVIAKLMVFFEAGDFGSKSTEARISDRFRKQQPFDPLVVSRTRGAIDVFSKERALSGPYRLNKANALSWLLFFSRFDNIPLPPQTMARFFAAGEASAGRDFVSDAISVFNDRSSLRVTDVSSVVYRDFTLWYAFYFLVSRDLPNPIQPELIEAIRNRMAHGDPERTFEDTLDELVPVSAWSGTL